MQAASTPTCKHSTFSNGAVVPCNLSMRCNCPEERIQMRAITLRADQLPTPSPLHRGVHH